MFQEQALLLCFVSTFLFALFELYLKKSEGTKGPLLDRYLVYFVSKGSLGRMQLFIFGLSILCNNVVGCTEVVEGLVNRRSFKNEHLSSNIVTLPGNFTRSIR
eukprot:TRINITY_DN4968_c0_g1_i3.p1 TRINITY_DN4968_c0_g1~~TRINITY_DN4968_c0_g1_i3.p1  ORF type:complete len:103 (+),score=2.08 TRINITY_DN4968_c0_g1_i3:66-374(+)